MKTRWKKFTVQKLLPKEGSLVYKKRIVLTDKYCFVYFEMEFLRCKGQVRNIAITLLTGALKLYDLLNHDETTRETPKANYLGRSKFRQ